MVNTVTIRVYHLVQQDDLRQVIRGGQNVIATIEQNRGFLDWQASWDLGSR